LQATGGGSFKFGDDFRDKLGVSLDKLDEMDSVVSGANFLLQVSRKLFSSYLLISIVNFQKCFRVS
jgi:type II pantothenate kinase